MSPCFGDDFNQGEVSCSSSINVFKVSSDYVAALPGFDIGYYLTDNIKVAAELATVFFATEISASLYYYHKIKNTDITPYISASIGIDDALFSDRLFVYRVSFGVSFPLFSDINGFVGYRPMFS